MKTLMEMQIKLSSKVQLKKLNAASSTLHI